jgi:hypothetical protein
LDHVFIVATIIMGVAFVVVLFLPEKPLSRKDHGAAAETKEK